MLGSCKEDGTAQKQINGGPWFQTSAPLYQEHRKRREHEGVPLLANNIKNKVQCIKQTLTNDILYQDNKRRNGFLGYNVIQFLQLQRLTDRKFVPISLSFVYDTQVLVSISNNAHTQILNCS